MKVHIILRIFDGIPEEPQVFASQNQAWMVWVAEAPADTWWDDYHTDEHHLEMRHWTVSVQEASE